MKIDENCSEVVPTISQTSILMKKSVRSLFRVFLLLVFAATLGCRAAIRAVFTELQFEKSFVAGAPPAPAFNSTLLRFASIDIGEAQSKQEIEQLLEGSFVGAGRQRSFSTWRRFNHHVEDRARTSTGVPVSALLRSPKFYRYWLEFRRILQDWDRKKRYEPDIMMDLVKLVKHRIDLHRGAVMASDRKYQSCAVVGNSGILLNREYGRFIDGHDFVIRLNNARVEGFRLHVGSKTTLSFVNSNILHLCARREGCFCHPYGVEIPMILYICQPAHFLDYTFCNATHKAPLLITDPRFDVLCARIVKYYSLKRSIVENGKSLKEWVAAKGGAMFHYSSGVQAVMLALGICEKVSIFGFGKSASSKHHYHTNQKTELKLHDYEAEYDFYYDLVERPQALTMYPGTGREHIAGMKPFCKCLNRFELRVPGNIMQKLV